MASYMLRGFDKEALSRARARAHAEGFSFDDVLRKFIVEYADNHSKSEEGSWPRYRFRPTIVHHSMSGHCGDPALLIEVQEADKSRRILDQGEAYLIENDRPQFVLVTKKDNHGRS